MIEINGVTDAARRAARLAEVRAEKQRRAEAEEAERDEQEIQRFELVERFERETNGREGVDFAIVDVNDVREGFVVVKLGEAVLWKAFSNSKMTEVDLDAFTLPCVAYPDKDEYRKMVAKRGAIGIRVATALSGLYGARGKEDQGK